MKPNKTDIRPYTRQFFRGNEFSFSLALVYIILMTASNLLISWLLQQVMDLISGAGVRFNIAELTGISIAALLLVAVSFGFEYLSIPRFISRAISQYKNYAFDRLSEKGISAFSGENTSLYISALSNDAATIETNFLNNIFVIITNSALCIGALALMFFYSPTLTLISIGLSIVPLIAAICTGDLVAKSEKQVSDRNEAYMSTLKDSLVGFSVIKSFRAEAQLCRIFAENVRSAAEAKCLRRKMTIIVQFLATSAGTIVQIGVFLIGAYLALTGSAISPGTVLIFVQLLNFVVNPIGTIPQCIAECKAARALIEKLANALESNVREEGQEEKNFLSAAIEVRGLSFSYDSEKTALSGIDLRFEKGKSYAIVGGSGSGKSTLLNLLMASHSHYNGEIIYDETELRAIASRSLYDMISVVQQNVFIFNATIRDNITMFSDFPEEDIRAAISLSGLSALIAERGEDYLCGENGSGLSGGEKQRIAIARSLLKKSQVLLVDEATASLDAETAERVTGAILDLEGITRIIVTHDLDRPILSRCDEIIVLKNGSVVEQGTFDCLMEKKEYFYSLFTVSQ